MKKEDRIRLMDEVKKLYYDENKTATEIASIIRVNRTTIQRWLKKENPEKYNNYTSSSNRKNKKKNFSDLERKEIAKIWILLFSSGKKLREIAKKYNCSISFVSTTMKKYNPQLLVKIKTKLKVEKIAKRKELQLELKRKKEEERQMEAGMRSQQAKHAAQMSYGRNLSSYSIFMMYHHLYNRVEYNIYIIKSEFKNFISFDMPQKYVLAV